MSRKSFPVWVLCLCWITAIGVMGYRVWAHDLQPAPAASPGSRWPDKSGLSRVNGRDFLVMAVHPLCPCTRASLTELEAAATSFRRPIDLRVLVFEPKHKPAGWGSIGLSERAAQIPGVTVVMDLDGGEARHLGLTTSGEVQLYGGDGQLLFHGGITESRGHEGENPGLDRLLAAESEGKPSLKNTPVFGCSLFSNFGTGTGAQREVQ